MPKIKILTGSVRPGRFNIQAAKWIFDLAKKRKDADFELIDLAEINLPFLDEEATPVEHKYTKAHTKKWSALIDEADGYIFVTPEYNHSVSPVLKNAIDFLYHEWNWKPLAFVSYGNITGGSRAVEHLRGTAAELKMYDLREQVILPSYWNNLDEKGQYKFSAEQAETAKHLLDSLVFWAGEMKNSRAKLQKK